MAMACFGFVTFFPLRPDSSLPFFIAFISRSTDEDALGLYFLPVDFFADFFAAFLVVAIAFFSLIPTKRYQQWEAGRRPRGCAMPDKAKPPHEHAAAG
jgi:hypothetical protein